MWDSDLDVYEKISHYFLHFFTGRHSWNKLAGISKGISEVLLFVMKSQVRFHREHFTDSCPGLMVQVGTLTYNFLHYFARYCLLGVLFAHGRSSRLSLEARVEGRCHRFLSTSGASYSFDQFSTNPVAVHLVSIHHCRHNMAARRATVDMLLFCWLSNQGRTNAW